MRSEYLAYWGTRELIVRLPSRLIDPDVAQRYCSCGTSMSRKVTFVERGGNAGL